MTQEFHLRLITQRAAGGDPIIRERTLAGPELTIGRSTDSDILLTDLSVDPHHAKLRFTGPGRVRLESVGGAPFLLNGQSTQRVDFSVSGGPVAAFGDYRLAFEGSEDEGAVITVTREEHEHHPSPSIFSLKAPVFGRRNMAWGLGLGIFLICLLVPLIGTVWLSQAKIYPDQQWSSGPLSKAHAFLENDCKSCHAKAFVAVRDETCLSCHKAGSDPVENATVLARSSDGGSPFEPRLIAEHAPHDKLRAATPLPDALGPKMGAVIQRALNHPTDRCASCHLEHTKPEKTVSPDPKAPLSDKPTLVVVQDCESCHTKLKMRLTKTDLIDTPDWGRHPTFRPLIMTSAAGPKPTFQRVQLKGLPLERNGLIFPHKMHLDPLGGVARQAIVLGKAGGYGAALECASCHTPDAVGSGFKPIEMERDCASCHSLAFARDGAGRLKSLPHAELQKVVDTLSGKTLSAASLSDRLRPGTIQPTAFAANSAGAYRATFSKGGACYDCHTITWAGDTVQMAPVKLTQRYLPRGAFNHGVPEHGGPGQSKVGGFECVDCHKAQLSERTSDVLIPDIAKCASCHGKTEAQTKAADDADCTTCHSFHAPGKSTPPAGHPPLETLKWTQTLARRGRLAQGPDAKHDRRSANVLQRDLPHVGFSRGLEPPVGHRMLPG